MTAASSGGQRTWNPADGLVPEFPAAAETCGTDVVVHAWPYLEWVSGQGDPTHAEYDSIWASPTDEIAWLKSPVRKNWLYR